MSRSHPLPRPNSGFQLRPPIPLFPVESRSLVQPGGEHQSLRKPLPAAILSERVAFASVIPRPRGVATARTKRASAASRLIHSGDRRQIRVHDDSSRGRNADPGRVDRDPIPRDALVDRESRLAVGGERHVDRACESRGINLGSIGGPAQPPETLQDLANQVVVTHARDQSGIGTRGAARPRVLEGILAVICDQSIRVARESCGADVPHSGERRSPANLHQNTSIGHLRARKKGPRLSTQPPILHQCRRQDLNLHGLVRPPAPQAGASANSATPATLRWLTCEGSTIITGAVEASSRSAAAFGDPRGNPAPRDIRAQAWRGLHNPLNRVKPDPFRNRSYGCQDRNRIGGAKADAIFTPSTIPCHSRLDFRLPGLDGPGRRSIARPPRETGPSASPCRSPSSTGLAGSWSRRRPPAREPWSWSRR